MALCAQAKNGQNRNHANNKLATSKELGTQLSSEVVFGMVANKPASLSLPRQGISNIF
ncbi:hypothetical protein RIB2604_02302140 [Aspergillus luchuensis]|uniref:Uncharacterized protein n=1 Tax=Aspergillus kawachii TaxID=1069201 RepID=A0A146FQ35_ASPKA|nr:hypothetical protein RIB2604_02302140 [Aspergillus luchuensis]